MFGMKKNKNMPQTGNQVPQKAQKKNNNETREAQLTKKELQEELQMTRNGQKKVVKEVEKKFEKDEEEVLLSGSRKIKDFIAPSGFDRSAEDHITVSNKYVRSFCVNGFPSLVQIGWLDDLFNFNGNMDTSLFIVPADERGALDELTNKITQFEAQLMVEQQKGNIRNITRLQDTVQQLYAQRRALEQNYENLFHIQIVSSLYENSLEELNKQSSRLINRLKGRRIDINELYLRQDEGYKSTLPIGEMFIKDRLRNFNTGALTACFPFYNSEISHKDGIFLGINTATATPVLMDFYDRSILNNSNITVFGQAGSGKSFFLSLLTLRSALKNIRTVIIDPEGEYKNLTREMGGAYIKLAPNVATGINPFDIEEEFDPDMKIMRVDIKSKIADNLNLIAVMVGGLDKEAKSVIASVLGQMYDEKGFTEDPQSLMSDEASFDPETGEMIHNIKKPMPTLSDFNRLLTAYADRENNDSIKKIANTMKMFCKGGIYDLFDRQTSKDLVGFFDMPIISFDVSQLEESILRPIGMYISLTWTWEKFIKKNPDIKKRIICDEAWMLMNKNMAGCEFTAQFLENTSRRIRKRNGGLLVASQNFIEFADNPQGKAVLTNAVVNIFLQQSSTDIEAVKETFRLSEGEKLFLLTAKRGEMLIRCKGESSVALAYPFKYEMDLITKKYY